MAEQEPTEGEPTLDFVLKCNLTANEIFLSTCQGLRTVGDLRRVVSDIYDNPRVCQRLIQNGRGLQDYPDANPLSDFFRTPWEGDRIVFVLCSCGRLE